MIDLAQAQRHVGEGGDYVWIPSEILGTYREAALRVERALDEAKTCEGNAILVEEGQLSHEAAAEVMKQLERKDEEDKATSLSVIRGGDCAPDQETRTGTTALFVACHAGDSKLVHNCVEINQCVGCTRQFFTKSFLGDDAAVLAPSSGEEPASPRHRAGVASMAWRATRRSSTNAP